MIGLNKVSKTYQLHNWSVVTINKSLYSAPEYSVNCLRGLRDNEDRHVRTSPIVSVNGRLITTKTGSIYHLHEMDPEYEKWLIENNIKINYDSPIVLK